MTHLVRPILRRGLRWLLPGLRRALMHIGDVKVGRDCKELERTLERERLGGLIPRINPSRNVGFLLIGVPGSHRPAKRAWTPARR